MLVGFVLSALLSILLGPYFERFGPLLFDQTKVAVENALVTGAEIRQEEASPQVDSTEELDRDAIESIDARLKKLKNRSVDSSPEETVTNGQDAA